MAYWEQLVVSNPELKDVNQHTKVTMSVAELKRLIDKAESHGHQLATSVQSMDDDVDTDSDSPWSVWSKILQTLRLRG